MIEEKVSVELSLEDVDTILNALDLKSASILGLKDYIYNYVKEELEKNREENKE